MSYYELNKSINRDQLMHYKETEKFDNVLHPSHYNKCKYECIDVLDEICKDMNGRDAAYTFNIMKYMWRWQYKNGVEDLKKARFYLNRLIIELEEEEERKSGLNSDTGEFVFEPG